MIGFGRMMVKDAKVILRHRLLLIILLLYPFVFMAIIGLTFSENREMRLGVVYEEAAGAPAEGAKIWIEGEPYDNRGLVERFLGGDRLDRRISRLGEGGRCLARRAG